MSLPLPSPRQILPTLPYDILHAIVSHLHVAHPFAALAATCKPLRSFVATSGWKIFVQTSFPSLHVSLTSQDTTGGAHAIDWRKYAEDLTALSRNYDSRGFMAGLLDPDVVVPTPLAPHTRRRGRGVRGSSAARSHHRWSEAPGKGRQTMGFHPVLDVYSPSLSAADEVLAIGAGPDLLMRRRDGSGRSERWWAYEERNSVAGKDDITVMHLLHNGQAAGWQQAVVGRANGSLQLLKLHSADAGGGIGTAAVQMSFETGGQSVRSAALLQAGSEHRLLSAVLGSSAVSVWKMPPAEKDTAAAVAPLAEWSAPDGPQLWTTAFLSPALLAVGKTAKEPLSVHALSPHGLVAEPVRTFSVDDVYHTTTKPSMSSVYAIAPLPPTTSGSESGQIFLSGWYYGSTLCVSAPVCAFRAPADCMPGSTIFAYPRLSPHSSMTQ